MILAHPLAKSAHGLFEANLCAEFRFERSSSRIHPRLSMLARLRSRNIIHYRLLSGDLRRQRQQCVQRAVGSPLRSGEGWAEDDGRWATEQWQGATGRARTR